MTTLDPRVAAAYLDSFRLAAKVTADLGLKPRDLLHAVALAYGHDDDMATRLEQAWRDRLTNRSPDPWAPSVPPQRRQGD